MSSKQHPNDSKYRHVLVSRNCIALVLHRVKTDAFSVQEDGHNVFADFLQQNSLCFWNACLMRSVASLEYRGCLVPTTLLLSGTNFALEVVRSAWARRVLRPPKGYAISKLGDVGSVDMLPVLQTQFAPLSEALCKVVADLNGDHLPATTESIRSRLEDSFPEMQVPCEDILHKTLGGLIRERKIYHTGSGYFVVSPDTYRQRATSPLCERQMLMTNEEAIVRLHGEARRDCSLAVQVDEMDIAAAWRCSTSSFLQATAKEGRKLSNQSTQVPSSPDLQVLERSHSLKMVRMRKGRPNSTGDGTMTMDRGGSFKESKKIGFIANEFDGDVNDIHKSEKQSMLAKLLKRMQFLTDKSAKHVVFSAQFPPLEWLESDKMRCHSVATQTQILLQKAGATKSGVKRLEQPGPRIPWEDTQNEFDNKIFSYHLTPNGSHRRLFNESDESSPRKNMSLPSRPNNSKYSPSHRYSHGTFTNYSKRRHKHRRSSSESPKINKNLINGYQSHSTSSKSNADNSDDKTNRSSSNGSTKKEPKIASKPSVQSEWKRANNCLSKNETLSGRESSIQSPSSSLEREVLKDMKNLATVHAKSSTPKLENILLKPEPTEEMKDAKEKGNELSKDSPLKVTSTTTEEPSKRNESSLSEKSVSCNEPVQTETIIQPLVLKSFVDIPKPKASPQAKSPPKEIIIDNSVSVEVALDKTPKSKTNNVSTTIVTEETTVTKANGNSKVVTVTSITTSLSNGGLKDLEKHNPDQSFMDSDASSDKDKLSVNDLNIETEKGARIIDCTSSCNIVTEVK